MRVITYLCESKWKPYKEMAEYLGKSAVENGYTFTTYLVGNDAVRAGFLGWKDGKKIYYIGGNGKPGIIRRALDQYSGEDIIFMDADCVIQKPMGDVLNNCDVAITIKPPELRGRLKFFEAYANTGVMFFKNNDNARRFIDLWNAENIDEMRWDCSGTDQASLNRLMLKYSDIPYGITMVDGISVKAVHCEKYNFCFLPSDPKDAFVIHYKGLNFRLHPLNKEAALVG